MYTFVYRGFESDRVRAAARCRVRAADDAGRSRATRGHWQAAAQVRQNVRK